MILSSTDGGAVGGTEVLFNEGIVHDSEITALLLTALMECVELADKELLMLKITKGLGDSAIGEMFKDRKFIATDADLEEAQAFIDSRKA